MQQLWLSSCLRRVPPETVYQQGQTLFRTGDFRPSLEKAQLGLRTWPGGELGWRFRLLAVEDLSKISRGEEARALLKAAGTPVSPGLQARWKMDQANLAGGSTKEKLLREAVPLAVASRDAEVISMVELYLGETVQDLAEGDAHLDASFAAANQVRDPFLLTWVQLARGYNKLRFSRFDAALPYLDEALAAARRYGARSLIATILGNQGWCYFRLGDLDRAMEVLTRAESLAATLGQPDLRQRWLGAIGNVYFARGDFDRAEALHQRAAKVAGEAGNEEWQAIAWHNLAEIAMEKNDLPSALIYSDKAQAVNRRRGNLGSLVYSELTAAEIEQMRNNRVAAESGYLAVIRRAPEASAPDVLWQAYANLGSLYAQWHKTNQAATAYRGAIDTIDREWNRLSSEDSKATFLAPHLVGLFQDYVNLLLETGHPEQALEIAESARARILNQRLERRGAIPPDFDMAGLQRAARLSRTVILSYWVAPTRSSVWVIGAGRLSRAELPPGRKITSLVRKYVETITQGSDPLTRQDPASLELYQAVLAPVHKLIPAGSNVIIVPDGALHELSFGTLVVPGPPPHYWIEDVDIATAPSLRVLRADARKTTRTPKLLLVGDPVLTGQEFPPLPNVSKEIAAVEEHFPLPHRTVFTGASAVPAVYAQASPGDYTDIHFATHATANRDSPLNSAIILSHQGEDYKLYARDVAGVPLSADLVTISACRSAGAKAYSGEGLMGFAWAFLQAGARNVIATLWNEDDASSVELMRTLYAGVSAGQTPAAALRLAKLGLIHPRGAGASRTRLPYYWGPLQVFTREIAAPASRRYGTAHDNSISPTGRE